MRHIRNDAVQSQELRVDSGRRHPIKYVWAATSFCGLTRPSETLAVDDGNREYVEALCPGCVALADCRAERKGRRLV